MSHVLQQNLHQHYERQEDNHVNDQEMNEDQDCSPAPRMAGLLPYLLAATLGLTAAQYSSCTEQYYDKFFKCGAGVAYETPCYKGLSYNPEIHVCDYPDQVPYCEKQSEGLVGFKYSAPHKLSPNAVAKRLLGKHFVTDTHICTTF